MVIESFSSIATMLDSRPSSFVHALQNVALILLSFIFIPLDTGVVLFSYALQTLLRLARRNEPVRRSNNPRRILITGVGMTKGLSLARLFHKSGHIVTGADFEPHGIPSPGRVSTSLHKFHPLDKPSLTTGSSTYIQSLLFIILQEKIDLWVSCSGVASAVEDGEAKEIIENRTNCKAIQFDVATTQTLHEKHTFMSHTREIGLTIPQTHTAVSREDVEKALEGAPKGMRFIMKTVGMNDQARGDMTLLPLESKEVTEKHLDRLEISKKNEWILQQFIEGEEFCTHALVIRGEVLAFVACPSSDLLMHYEGLDSKSKLNQAMLRFTQYYATNGGEGFTGHLSFDFLVEDPTSPDPVLYPIECNPRAHTAVALFNDTPAIVDSYLGLLESSPKASKPIIPTNRQRRYYWTGHDLVAHFIYPLSQLLLLKISFAEFTKHAKSFLTHLFSWKDGTYSLWDPLPWFFLYHVYWPAQFFVCLMVGKKWSRINVSTLKMFEC